MQQPSSRFCIIFVRCLKSRRSQRTRVRPQSRRVTLDSPIDLLRRAQAATNEGVTATIRKGLELVASSRASDALRKLRGGVRFSIDWRELRDDRASRV